MTATEQAGAVVLGLSGWVAGDHAWFCHRHFGYKYEVEIIGRGQSDGYHIKGLDVECDIGLAYEDELFSYEPEGQLITSGTSRFTPLKP